MAVRSPKSSACRWLVEWQKCADNCLMRPQLALRLNAKWLETVVRPRLKAKEDGVFNALFPTPRRPERGV